MGCLCGLATPRVKAEPEGGGAESEWSGLLVVKQGRQDTDASRCQFCGEKTTVVNGSQVGTWPGVCRRGRRKIQGAVVLCVVVVVVVVVKNADGVAETLGRG